MSWKIFAEICKTNDLVEELASGAELEDDVVVLTGFGEFHELDDIGVIEYPHDLNFFEDVGTLHIWRQ